MFQRRMKRCGRLLAAGFGAVGTATSPSSAMMESLGSTNETRLRFDFFIGRYRPESRLKDMINWQQFHTVFKSLSHAVCLPRDAWK